MPFYQRNGTSPPTRFTVLRCPSGELLHEELLAAGGFVGESSTLYHLFAPKRITRTESFVVPDLKPWNEPMANLLFKPDRVSTVGDFVAVRLLFLGDDLIYSIFGPDQSMEGFYRNVLADELVVVAEGAGVVETAFSGLTYGQYDFVVVLRGVTARWLPDGPQCLVVVETKATMRAPARHRGTTGELLDNSLYHERDVGSPLFEGPAEERGDLPVVVKAGERAGRCVFDRHSFDVGWDGYHDPYAVSMRDFEAVSGMVYPVSDRYQVLEAGWASIGRSRPASQRLPPRCVPRRGSPQEPRLGRGPLPIRYCGGRAPAHRRVHDAAPARPRPRSQARLPGGDAAHRARHVGLMVDTRYILRPTVSAMNAQDASYASTWL